MSLIDKEVIAPKKKPLSIRLDPELSRLLESYCIFIQSSQNYVIERSLRYTFTKDRDFQLWLSTQETTEEKE